MTITENRRSRAHVDGVLIALVFAMSLFGIVAVCVATYSPSSSPDASFLNRIFESSYATRQCLFCSCTDRVYAPDPTDGLSTSLFQVVDVVIQFFYSIQI